MARAHHSGRCLSGFSVPVSFKSPFIANIFGFIPSSCIVRLVCSFFFVGGGSFPPNISQHVFPSLVLSLVGAVSLPLLLAKFPIQVLYICSGFWGEHQFYPKLVSSLHRINLFNSVTLLAGIFVINLFTFSVSTVTFSLSWFLRDSDVLFFLDTIFFIMSTFVLSSGVNICFVVLGSIVLWFSVYCISIRLGFFLFFLFLFFFFGFSVFSVMILVEGSYSIFIIFHIFPVSQDKNATFL